MKPRSVCQASPTTLAFQTIRKFEVLILPFSHILLCTSGMFDSLTAVCIKQSPDHSQCCHRIPRGRGEFASQQHDNSRRLNLYLHIPLPTHSYAKSLWPAFILGKVYTSITAFHNITHTCNLYLSFSPTHHRCWWFSWRSVSSVVPTLTMTNRDPSLLQSHNYSLDIEPAVYS